MNIKPLEKYILLQEVKSNVTDAGIILTEDVNIDKPNIANVLKVGKKVELVKEGDKVLFKRHLFDEVNFKEAYLLGKEEGIMAVID